MKENPLAMEVYKKKLDFIKKNYKPHGITSYEIALGVGMTASTVNRIFNGQTKRPGKNTVDRIYNYILDQVNKNSKSLGELNLIEKDTGNSLNHYSIDQIIGNLLERQDECLNNTSYIVFKKMLSEEVKYEKVYAKIERHDEILDRLLKKS